MSLYLYGAAVQGIQNFIFETNELKDIVGASELVEKICTSLFAETINSNISKLKEDPNAILNAAGNIKYIFKEEDECRKVVLNFPRKVMGAAPGITISQAVVKFDNDFPSAVDELEDKLRAQRNKPMPSSTIGYIGIQRARKTGKPAVNIDGGDYLDDASYKKRFDIDGRKRTTKTLCEKCFGETHLQDNRIAYDIEDITGQNSWIAIIHADGNGLGQVVREIGRDKEQFRAFSKGLDKSTIEAARIAFDQIMTINGSYQEMVIPFRPIVLGGDDLTMICRGDLAIPFVKAYMEQFENLTEENTGRELTACAGIAFIKSSYPFYYGYSLAESLCDAAKKDAKKEDMMAANDGLVPSCLMFHKVQDSFIESYKDIAKMELTTKDGYSFSFGPYYLNEQKDRWNIEKLIYSCNLLSDEDGNAIKTHLRKWISLMIDNGSAAEQHIFRLLEMIPQKRVDLKRFILEITYQSDKTDDPDHPGKSPVYDILALNAINNIETKQ